MKTAAWAAVASGWLVLLAGCGLPANPQSPSLWLPQPVRSLTASRVGNQVHLHWMMPRLTTDKVQLQGKQRAHICWVYGLAAPPGKHPATGPVVGCHPAGDASFLPDEPAVLTATLPATLIAQPRRGVSYFVELENPAGKTAGPSNPAWIATGDAPSAVTGLHLETSQGGVVLHWQPAAPRAEMVMRIHRMLVNQTVASKSAKQGAVPLPSQQTLEVSLATNDSGGAVDRDAALDHIWRYWVERVLRVQVDGHSLEIAGQPSATETIDAKDIFPPAVPLGLAVVPDDQARTMNLSWTPDTAPDLAGYLVYRRDLTAGDVLKPISGTTPLVAPSFQDTSVVPGHRYAYSVSAVDQDGNQSSRSPEVVEVLNQ